MKRFVQVLGTILVAIGITACSNESPASPSANSVQMFTANLSAANEVPPIAGDEAGAAGAATLTFNPRRSASGTIDSATVDIAVTVSGFPNGTALTNAHIHAGAAGVNGGVFVAAGIAAGEITFPNGSGSFTKTGIAISADQVNAILANPGAFYFNIHTARNPDGVARGQLRAQ
jgi:CHRD domain-containing protein